MKFKKFLLVSSLLGALSFSFTPTIDVLAQEITYEESLELPLANSQNDNTSTQSYSASSPQSIEDYEEAGYTNIQYTTWTGEKNMISSKAKRVGATVASALAGTVIKSKSAQALISIFSVGAAFQDQEADVYPTYNARNIIATAPIGYETRIGEEVIVNYYSDSARTNLVKTVRQTFWI